MNRPPFIRGGEPERLRASRELVASMTGRGSVEPDGPNYDDAPPDVADSETFVPLAKVIAEAKASWWRQLRGANGHTRQIFEGSIIPEAARLTKFRPDDTATIADIAWELAELHDIAPDDFQAMFTRAKEIPNAPQIEAPAPQVQAPQDQPIEPLAFFDAAAWHDQPVPERKWLVPGRIPDSKVTILSGDGAIGKTTIALQLCAAVVRGADWLNAVVDRKGPAMFFSAEEDRDEVHRRVCAIARHFQIPLSDLAGLHVHCADGADTLLGAPEGRSSLIRPTRLFHRLKKAAVAVRPALIVIESAANVYGGNENDRSQVDQFCQLLRQLATESGAAVLLLQHPSLSGLASKTGTSGTTHWNNAVRSRLYFAKAKEGDGEETDARELAVHKSNYGPSGECVRVRWHEGVFIPASSLPTDKAASDAEADAEFLRLLDACTKQGRFVTDTNSSTYALAVFAAAPDCKLTKSALKAAMERLFASGAIILQEEGPPSKRRKRIVRAGAVS